MRGNTHLHIHITAGQDTLLCLLSSFSTSVHSFSSQMTPNARLRHSLDSATSVISHLQAPAPGQPSLLTTVGPWLPASQGLVRPHLLSRHHGPRVSHSLPWAKSLFSVTLYPSLSFPPEFFSNGWLRPHQNLWCLNKISVGFHFIWISVLPHCVCVCVCVCAKLGPTLLGPHRL